MARLSSLLDHYPSTGKEKKERVTCDYQNVHETSCPGPFSAGMNGPALESLHKGPSTPPGSRPPSSPRPGPGRVQVRVRSGPGYRIPWRALTSVPAKAETPCAPKSPPSPATIPIYPTSSLSSVPQTLTPLHSTTLLVPPAGHLGSRVGTQMGAAGQLRRRTRARTPPGPRPEAAAAGDDDDVRCEACGSGDAAPELMLCDGCDRGFHIFCLRPILPRVPAGDWYCPSCRSPASSKSQSAAAAAHTVVAKKPKREFLHFLCDFSFN